MAGKAHDPAFNEPRQVQIQGHKFGVREISWPSARRKAMAIKDLMVQIKEKNPDVKLADLDTVDKMLSVVFKCIDELMDGSADLVEAIVMESAGLSEEEISDLPLCVFIELVGEVIEAQAPVIVAFLALERKLRRLDLGAKPSKAAAPQPSVGTLPISPASASTTRKRSDSAGHKSAKSSGRTN